MDIIQQWKEEAQVAFSEYKKRDCGTRVYTKDKMCRRVEYAIINAYLDFLCFVSNVSSKNIRLKLKRCSKPKHKVLTLNQIKKGEYTVKKGKKKTKVKIKKSSCVGYLNQVLKAKGCYTSDKGKYTTYKKYKSYFTKYTGFECFI